MVRVKEGVFVDWLETGNPLFNAIIYVSLVCPMNRLKSIHHNVLAESVNNKTGSVWGPVP